MAVSQLASLSIAVKTGDIKRASDELHKLEKAGLKAERGTDRLTQSNKNLASTLTSLPALFSGVIIGMGVSKVIEYADAMTLVDSRLKLVTNGTQELATAQAELFAISQNTRTSFTDTVDLFSRMARTTEELNISQSELLGITNTINQALIVSGSSAESANAALIQLSQGFASGTLRGEELNSVMEQTPRLAQAIAEGMGVSIGQLRALGAAGELTAEKVLNSLKTQAEAVSSEFNQMNITVEQGQTQVNNSVIAMVGNIDKAIGASESLANALTSVSEGIDNNLSDIVHFSRFTFATLDRTVDGFNVLWETVENTAQGVVYGLNIVVYGALDSITEVVARATEALNGLGLASDEAVKQNRALANFIDKEYNKALKGYADGWKEIDAAVRKFSPTVEERYQAMVREESQLTKNKKAVDSISESWEETYKKLPNKAFNELDKKSQKIWDDFNKKSKKETDKYSDYLTTQISGSLINGVEAALNDGSVKGVVENLGNSIGKSMGQAAIKEMIEAQALTSGGLLGLAGGIGLMAFSSLMSKESDTSGVDKFTQQLEEATKSLKEFGNEGSALALEIATIQNKIASLPPEAGLAALAYDRDIYTGLLADTVAGALSGKIATEGKSVEELQAIAGVPDLQQFNQDYAEVIARIDEHRATVKQMQIDGATEAQIQEYLTMDSVLADLKNTTYQTYQNFGNVIDVMNEMSETRVETLMEEQRATESLRDAQLSQITDIRTFAESLSYQQTSAISGFANASNFLDASIRAFSENLKAGENTAMELANIKKFSQDSLTYSKSQARTSEEYLISVAEMTNKLTDLADVSEETTLTDVTAKLDEILLELKQTREENADNAIYA